MHTYTSRLIDIWTFTIEYFPDGGVHAYLPVRIGGTLETTELRLTMKNFFNDAEILAAYEVFS